MNHPVRHKLVVSAICIVLTMLLSVIHASKPIVKANLVFAAWDGIVAVEAEHFSQQTATQKPIFQLTTTNRNKSGKGKRTFPYPSGVYHVTLKAVGESDSPTKPVSNEPLNRTTPDLMATARVRFPAS